MGNIREEKGRNKKVYRAQFYERRLVIKEASLSEWVIGQAKREIDYSKKLDLPSVPKLLLSQRV